MFKQITIIAPGLLGASIGMAVADMSLAEKIHVWARRKEAREQCESLSWCAYAPENICDSVQGSDLVILCAPVAVIPSLVEKIAPSLKQGCIVTDVGSTKETLCSEALKVTPEDVYFVGSHPMAGSEKSGLENADASLFNDKTCFVTSCNDELTPVVETVTHFWEALGMQCNCISPREHDAIAAHISHLPHLLASTLCSYLSGKNSKWKDFSGTGLIDTTRIASGSPEIWDSIVKENISEIEQSLEGFQQELASLMQLVNTRDYEGIKALLIRGKEFRDSI